MKMPHLEGLLNIAGSLYEQGGEDGRQKLCALVDDIDRILRNTVGSPMGKGG